MSNIAFLTEIVTMSTPDSPDSLGTTKMVNHFLQKVYKLRSKTKVHMKVDHGVRALGYVAFKKYFP